MSILRGKHVAWLGAITLVCILAGALSACTANPPSKLPPPPLAVDALPGARAQVFRLAGNSAPDSAATVASVCSTEAGHCPVPAGTPAGLRCTCEATDGSYIYAGRTGEIPPMPEWANPSLKRH